jgi:hypothetical protein
LSLLAQHQSQEALNKTSLTAQAGFTIAGSNSSIEVVVNLNSQGWGFIGNGSAYVPDNTSGGGPGVLRFNDFDQLKAATSCWWASGLTYLSVNFNSGWTTVGKFYAVLNDGPINSGQDDGAWTQQSSPTQGG